MIQESRNHVILHCECGKAKVFKAVNNSAVWIAISKDDWGAGKVDVENGGHCRGKCPTCRVTGR